ncbi:MAG: VOC family protein [Deltaproteobacteria bacterium]|nr:VOC family protein [Deltaproteobacteria bacterium]
MARIRTFDHCGFVVEDIPRAHRFYEDLLGAKPLRIQNLNTHRLYKGFPVMSFVEMGGHRFEICLAQEPLAPQGAAAMPRIGFLLTEAAMDGLLAQLRGSETPYEGPVTYPPEVPLDRTIRVRDADDNILEFSVRKEVAPS